MKNFFKKIAVFLGIITALSMTFNLATTEPTYARDFLGMPSWDDGVTIGGEKDQEQLKNDIVKIALNILTALTVLAAYLVLGYVIYGGYLYMFASGDAGKIAAGKKTLQHAFIGLAIVMSASVIFGAIRIAVIGNNSLGSCDPLSGGCVEPGEMVTNLIQWFIGIGGAVAAIFVVIGAWGYISSSGDPSKLQKAKATIIYALIGLAIVALAEVLTAFISGVIRDANANAYLPPSQIQEDNTLIAGKENTK